MTIILVILKFVALFFIVTPTILACCWFSLFVSGKASKIAEKFTESTRIRTVIAFIFAVVTFFLSIKAIRFLFHEPGFNLLGRLKLV